MKKHLITLAVCTLLVGCATVFNSTIAVTEIVDSAMKQWARLSNTQQTTPEFDTKVVVAHDRYRQSAAVAQATFNLYKVTNNASDLNAALQAARDGAGPLIDLIASIVAPASGVKLKTALTKASIP